MSQLTPFENEWLDEFIWEPTESAEEEYLRWCESVERRDEREAVFSQPADYNLCPSGLHPKHSCDCRHLTPEEWDKWLQENPDVPF